MGRPTTVTTAQVHDQARAMFIEFGPTLPIKKIAEKLGVSDAALFKRFGSKQDLYVGAMSAKISELPDFGLISDQLPAREILSTACEMIADYFENVTPVMLQIATSKKIGFDQTGALDCSAQIFVLIAKFEVLLNKLFAPTNRSHTAFSQVAKAVAKTTISALHMTEVYKFSKIDAADTPSRDDVIECAWHMVGVKPNAVSKPADHKANKSVAKTKTVKVNAKAPTTESPRQMDIFG